jgi:3-oxoacyl-[acyl-carrier protein] reductase
MTENSPMFAKPEAGFDRYDPAHVSPMVGWLSSPDSDGVNGQVFIVTGEEIHRIQQHIVATTIRAGEQRWTLEAITANKNQLFAGVSSTDVAPFGSLSM